MNEQKTRATMQFLAWAQRFSPEYAAAIVERVGDAPKAGPLNALGESWNMLGGLGEDIDAATGVTTTIATSTTTGGSGDFFSFEWANKALDVAAKAIPAYFQYDTQKQLMDLNITRAKNGLPPIDPGVVAPQVKVIMDLPPDVRGQLDKWRVGGANILLWGAVAVAGFFVVRAIR